MCDIEYGRLKIIEMREKELLKYDSNYRRIKRENMNKHRHKYKAGDKVGYWDHNDPNTGDPYCMSMGEIVELEDHFDKIMGWYYIIKTKENLRVLRSEDELTNFSR